MNPRIDNSWSEQVSEEIPRNQSFDARAILRRHGIRPKHRLGQNFMIKRSARQKVVAAAKLEGHETVMEIGAGLGALTRDLASACKRVVAVEVDVRLLPALELVLRSCENVEIISGDVLKLDVDLILGEQPYSVVANIPYYITSAVIRRFLEDHRRPQCMVLTIQKEVAERIIAAPGDMSLLALSVQVYGTAAIKARIPANAFYPQPKVDSAVLRVDGYKTPRVPELLIPAFFELARAGFGQKRKQIHNALSKNLGKPASLVLEWLHFAGIRPEQRAQELSLESWIRLAEEMVSKRD